MDRYANCPGLIGNSPGDCLTNPPGCIGAEFVTSFILKLINGLHKTYVAFLYKIRKMQALMEVFLGNADNKTEIGPNKMLFGVSGKFNSFVEPENNVLQLSGIEPGLSQKFSL